MSKNALNKRFEQTTFKLRALLNITLAINENLTRNELLQRYEDMLHRDLNIGKLLLFKLEDTWKCILNKGYDDAFVAQIDAEKDLYNTKRSRSTGGVRTKKCKTPMTL